MTIGQTLVDFRKKNPIDFLENPIKIIDTLIEIESSYMYYYYYLIFYHYYDPKQPD